jgi:hypothetical protein
MAASSTDPAAWTAPSQAQHAAQVQAMLASLTLQAQARAELQVLQQTHAVQQRQQYMGQQHPHERQLLLAQATAAAAAAAARQHGAAAGWALDRRALGALAAGKLSGHGSGGSTCSSGGRRSSRGGDAQGGASARDSRKASTGSGGGAGGSGSGSGSAGAGGSGSRRASAQPDWRRVFVGNIGWWVDEAMLQHVFGAYGSIQDVQVRAGWSACMSGGVLCLQTRRGAARAVSCRQAAC